MLRFVSDRTLSWSPSRESSGVMVVGCWDRTLSFYQASGAQVGKDKVLDFLPTHVSHFTGGEYITVCGSNRKVLHLLDFDMTFSPCLCSLCVCVLVLFIHQCEYVNAMAWTNFSFVGVSLVFLSCRSCCIRKMVLNSNLFVSEEIGLGVLLISRNRMPS